MTYYQRIERDLRAAEQQGARIAVRSRLNGTRATYRGGRHWERAFSRGVARGEVAVVLAPWRRVGSGVRQ